MRLLSHRRASHPNLLQNKPRGLFERGVTALGRLQTLVRPDNLWNPAYLSKVIQ